MGVTSSPHTTRYRQTPQRRSGTVESNVTRPASSINSCRQAKPLNPRPTSFLEWISVYTLLVAAYLAWILCAWDNIRWLKTLIWNREKIAFFYPLLSLCCVLVVSPILSLVQTRNQLIPLLYVIFSTTLFSCKSIPAHALLDLSDGSKT